MANLQNNNSNSFWRRFLNTIFFWNQGKNLKSLIIKKYILKLNYFYILEQNVVISTSNYSIKEIVNRKYICIDDIEKETKFSKTEIKFIYRGFKQVFLNIY